MHYIKLVRNVPELKDSYYGTASVKYRHFFQTNVIPFSVRPQTPKGDPDRIHMIMIVRKPKKMQNFPPVWELRSKFNIRIVKQNGKLSKYKLFSRKNETLSIVFFKLDWQIKDHNDVMHELCAVFTKSKL